MQIAEQKFENEGEVKSWLQDFFVSLSPSFYQKGIHDLSKG